MATDKAILKQRKNAREKVNRQLYPEKYKADKERRRPQQRIAALKYRLAHPGYRKTESYKASTKKAYRKRLLKQYGLTPEQYNQILIAQDHKCALCFSPNPGSKGTFHVDHDHKTNQVRGLLCHSCNTALGLFKDNPQILQLAIAYLLKNKTKPYPPVLIHQET